jgi:hypothetical protein
MKKINLILIIAVLLGVFPINIFAQFDYLDNMINNDQSIYESAEQNPEGNSGTETTSETINLKSIEIIWSTDSYVPYDYPGRALPSVDGFVDVTVALNLYQGKAENLQYSWFVDKTFDEQQSGYGKKNFRFGIRKNANEAHTVLVKIFNDDDSFYLEKSITIPIVSPEIIVYTSIKNPGFSELAKKTITIPTNKKSYFVAKPFFFSIKKSTDLNYQWQVSEQDAVNASGANANVLGLTVPKKENSERIVKDLLVNVNNGQAYSKQTAYTNILLQVQ